MCLLLFISMVVLWTLVIGIWRLWDQSFVCGGVCKGGYIDWLYLEVRSCDEGCMVAVWVVGKEVCI